MSSLMYGCRLAVAKFDPTNDGLLCGSVLILLGIVLLLYSGVGFEDIADSYATTHNFGRS